MSFVESEQRFHEKAIRQVGFDDFGDKSYLDGFRVLMAAYDKEAKFHDAGRAIAEQQIVGILTNRLRSQKLIRENPAVLEHEIRRPIVILGLIRTGSTALHYLIGQDPGIQALQYWLAAGPQPRPPRDQWESRPEFHRAEQEIEAMYSVDPSLKAIHFMRADLPEECRHLLAQNFTDDAFEVNATAPSFSAWYEKQDLLKTYERHRDLLKLIGSNDPERRWLLKYPVHMRYLDTLLEVYPDACVIQTHRDPANVFLSYCSLIANFRALFEDDIDREAITRRQMELWASGAEKCIEVRRRHDPAQFYDLHFHDFVSDPVGCVKRIYAYFDQPLSEEGERALVGWQESNPQHKHGKHEYSDDIGVTREEVWDRFAAYMKHYGMERE